MSATRKRRHTWQDPRRVRRMAVLLLEPASAAVCWTAAELDEMAMKWRNLPAWESYLKAAEHYLRELGRTRT